MLCFAHFFYSIINKIDFQYIFFFLLDSISKLYTQNYSIKCRGTQQLTLPLPPLKQNLQQNLLQKNKHHQKERRRRAISIDLNKCGVRQNSRRVHFTLTPSFEIALRPAPVHSPK